MDDEPLTPHESEVNERAERVLMSNAEAYRLAEEAVQMRRERDAARAWSRRWKEAAHEYRRDLRQATSAWADTLSEFQQASQERDALRAAGDLIASAIERQEHRVCNYACLHDDCAATRLARRWRALGDGAAGEGRQR